jgi:hypothetical protein
MSDSLKEALGVLDAFMAALNRGDEAGVNASFNFPHVRLASGKVTVWQKAGDYTLEGFYARAGEGWARSQWEERTPIHVGSDKVHFAVEFSRWRKDGGELSRHKSIYVVTRQDGRWGVQARSSFAA